MSSLPEIDHAKVSQRLASKSSETTLQLFQLEVLAEALRDERDIARADAQRLESEKAELQRTLDELQKDTDDDGV